MLDRERPRGEVGQGARKGDHSNPQDDTNSTAIQLVPAPYGGGSRSGEVGRATLGSILADAVTHRSERPESRRALAKAAEDRRSRDPDPRYHPPWEA